MKNVLEKFRFLKHAFGSYEVNFLFGFATITFQYVPTKIVNLITNMKYIYIAQSWNYGF